MLSTANYIVTFGLLEEKVKVKKYLGNVKKKLSWYFVLVI